MPRGTGMLLAVTLAALVGVTLLAQLSTSSARVAWPAHGSEDALEVRPMVMDEHLRPLLLAHCEFVGGFACFADAIAAPPEDAVP